jgi:alpha-tubulin suppressor-like RCC1 family protein
MCKQLCIATHSHTHICTHIHTHTHTHTHTRTHTHTHTHTHSHTHTHTHTHTIQIPLPPGAGRVVAVSAGYAHTVITDDKGGVYSFGQNENGQLAAGAEGMKLGARAHVERTSPLPA